MTSPRGAGEPSDRNDSAAGAIERRRGFARSWADSTLASFESPAYRLLWYGTFLGFVCFTMASTAQNIVAFDLTGDNRAVGTVMFGQGLAMLLLNPFGGAIADRLNKRVLLIVTQAILGGITLTIAILLQADLLTIPILAATAFVSGSMFAFLVPTRTSLIGDIVPSDRIGNAVVLVQVGGNFSRIAAPFLTGLLLSLSVIGPAGTYFIITGTFVFVLLFMSRIPASRSQEGGQGTVLDDLKLGIRHVLGNARLAHGIISHYCLTALGFCFFVLMPGFVKNELELGTAEVGAMLGVAAVGGLLGSIVVASLADSRSGTFVLRIVGFMAAAGLAGVGLSPGLAPALVFMLVAGAGTAAFQTLNNAIALRQADPAYYGRVMGLMQIAWGLLMLVSLPTGALADLAGERAVFSGAGATLAVVLFLLFAWERRISGSAEQGRV